MGTEDILSYELNVQCQGYKLECVCGGDVVCENDSARGGVWSGNQGSEAGLEKTRVFYKKKTNPLGFFNKTRVLLGFMGFLGILGFSKRNK